MSWQKIIWRAAKRIDGSKDENANESDCGNYTLARGMYAGEWWYEAHFGHGGNTVFLQRSPDRSECESACESHKLHLANPTLHVEPNHQLHENGDGI